MCGTLDKHPFDISAETYDRDFTNTDLGRWLRSRVWERLAAQLQPGDSVLEIGCGTGEDAVWLAQRGVRVLATDVSSVMLERTQQKTVDLGLNDLVQTEILNLNQLPTAMADRFDGVFSNFGPVNCTHDWTGLGVFLGTVVKSGGFVGLGVMSPFCLWETVWHSLRFNFRTAFRRIRRRTVATLADGSHIPVYYPSSRQLATALKPSFRQINVRGIGVFLPPSDVFGAIEKRPQLARRLMALETRWAHRWPFRTWADHYWIEFVRE